MNIESVKKMVEAADNGNANYDECDSSRPWDEGWEHLGEDFFVSRDGNWVCGPSGGDSTRTLAEA